MPRAAFLKQLCSYPLHVVAYSMGARLCLEALFYYDAPFLSLTCLSPTLVTSSLQQRKELENKWIKELTEGSVESFINNWYKQPIFSGFSPPKERFSQKKEDLIHVLKDYSFSNCPPLLPKIPSCKTPLQFLFRKNDPKAKCLENNKNLHFLNEGSHAIHLEQTSSCIELIYSFITNQRSQQSVLD